MKKILSALLLTTVLWLVSCEDTSLPSILSSNTQTTVEPSYRGALIELSEGGLVGGRYEYDYDYMTHFLTSDNRAAIIADHLDEELYAEHKAYAEWLSNATGHDISVKTYGRKEACILNPDDLTISALPLRYYTINGGKEEENYFLPLACITGMPDGGAAALLQNNTLIRWDSTGEPIFTIPYSEYVQSLAEEITSSYLTTSITTNADGSILLYTGGSIAVFSSEGEHLFNIAFDREITEAIAWAKTSDGQRTRNKGYPAFTTDEDGSILFCYPQRDNEGQLFFTVIPLDMEARRLGEPMQLPDTGNYAPILAPGYDVYYMDEKGVNGVNSGSAPLQLFTWTDVDLTPKLVVKLYIHSAEKMTVIAHDYTDPFFVIIDLSQEASERQIIRLACDDSATSDTKYDLASQVRKFNLTNEKYRVEYVVYSDDEGGKTAMEKLRNDIVTGNSPDVILFNEAIEVEPFLKMDALLDLYTLMDGDSQYGRGAFLPCVLTPFENSDGSLPLLTLDYSVNTMICKKATLAAGGDWTIDDIISINDQLEDSQSLIRLTVRTGENAGLVLFERLLPNLLESFIDYENETCDFSGDFRRLLEFCRSSALNIVSYTPDPELYQNGTVLLNPVEYGLHYFILDRYANFGCDDIAYIGFPDSGNVIIPHTQAAITTHCQSPEGAWEFIKSCLDQQTLDWEPKGQATFNPIISARYFPATYEALDAMFHYAQDYEYYMKAYLLPPRASLSLDAILPTEPVPNLRDYYTVQSEKYLAGGAVMLTLTDDDKAALTGLLEGITAAYTRDSESIAIILEDAADYFNGVKSMDEVTKLIQKRVSTRISE